MGGTSIISPGNKSTKEKSWFQTVNIEKSPGQVKVLHAPEGYTTNPTAKGLIRGYKYSIDVNWQVVMYAYNRYVNIKFFVKLSIWIVKKNKTNWC